jgi:large conductance mechanosensitive channel
MSLVSEFKAFVMRGNVVDLAVGVIIGAAFGGLVNSLVADILMPPIGWATGGVNFSDLAINLPGSMIDPATKDLPPEKQVKIPVKIAYGKFLQKIFDFLIIAMCLFFIIKAMNTVQKKQPQAPPEPTASEKLLAEIRDELKKR